MGKEHKTKSNYYLNYVTHYKMDYVTHNGYIDNV